MGYSARYHVASLAAVFLALGVGILIGTGLGKNVINGATSKLESSLKSDLDSARGQVATLRGQLHQQQDFAQSVYPALTNGALRGERVAVVALGGVDGSLRADIERVLGQQNATGARIREFVVVREPPDVPALNGEVRGTRYHPLRRRNATDLNSFGRHAARAIVAGGPFFRRVSGGLLSLRSGRPTGIDSVIVVRAAPTGLKSDAAAATSGLEDGLLDGFEATGLPVVGVERTATDPSSISLFRSHSLATVDDVDQMAGSVSLVYALHGANGSYGVGPTANRLMPPLGRVHRAITPLTGLNLAQTAPPATQPADTHTKAPKTSTP
jgi:copper transport outer membrane protein MctB